MQTKTFRLFISSTFSDFREERKVLQTKVFPYIKEYTTKQGYTFQPIDLRWGVSNEAQLDQKTLELCLDEIRACKSHKYPNFLIMLGDRYGWVPLPYAIEKDEFDLLLNLVDDERDRGLLKEWYKLDLNQLVASYILKERSGEFEEFDTWSAIEEKLRKILQSVVKISDLNENKKRKYFLSATEAEVEEGILAYKSYTKYQDKLITENSNLSEVDSQYIFSFQRYINKNSQQGNNFIDYGYDEAQSFKKEVKSVLLDENIFEARTKQINGNSLDTSYLLTFETRVLEFLKNKIDKQIKDEQNAEFTPLELELQAQNYFATTKRQNFMGQEQLLQEINRYIFSNEESSEAFVVYGESGRGKSALIAKAIQNTQDKSHSKIIYRFVGATPNSYSMQEILISVLEELNYVIEDELREYSFEEFSDDLHDTLNELEDDVVIFIDAVDQLQHVDQFLWLPKELPANVKIVISVLKDENYKEDSTYLQALQRRTGLLYEMPKFTEARELLKSLLESEGRTIQENQENYFLKQFESSPTPLYVLLASHEMKHWKSNDYTEGVEAKEDGKKQSLECTQKGIIEEFMGNLDKLYHHDKDFVQKVFAYIFASRDGLSESELLQLLSADGSFVQKMAPETWHENSNKELPLVHWTRLHTHLRAFLSLKTVGNETLMSFFHREFLDVISRQTSQKDEHEEIVKATQKFVKNNVDKDFFSNRWGKLYCTLVEHYGYLYPREESSLKKYSEFLVHLKGNEADYISTTLHYLDDLAQNYEKNNFYNRFAVLTKIQYFMYKFSFGFGGSKASILLNVMTKLGRVYTKQNQNALAIKYYEEALEYIADENVEDLSVMSTKIEMAPLYIDYYHEDKAYEMIREVAHKSANKLYTSLPAVDGRLVKVFFESHLQLTKLNVKNEALAKASEIIQEVFPLVAQLIQSGNDDWMPYYINFSYLQIEVYLVENNLEAAEKLLERIRQILESFFEQEPRVWMLSNVEYYYNFAKLRLQEKNFSESITLISNAIALSKEQFELYPKVWSIIHIKNLELLSEILLASKEYERYLKELFSIKQLIDRFYHHDKRLWKKRKVDNVKMIGLGYLAQKDVVHFIEVFSKLKNEFYEKYNNILDEVIESTLNIIQLNELLDIFYKHEMLNLQDEQIALLYAFYGRVQEREKNIEFASELYKGSFDTYINLLGAGHEFTIEMQKKLQALDSNQFSEFEDGDSDDIRLYKQINQYRENGKRIEALETLEELIKLLKTIPDKKDFLQKMQASIPELTLDVATFYKSKGNMTSTIKFYKSALVHYEQSYEIDPKDVARSYIICLDNYANTDGSQYVLLRCDKKAYNISKDMFEIYPEGQGWDDDFFISTKNYYRTLLKFKMFRDAYNLIVEGIDVYHVHIKNGIKGLIKSFTTLNFELLMHIDKTHNEVEIADNYFKSRLNDFIELYLEYGYDDYGLFLVNILHYSGKLGKYYQERDLFVYSRFTYEIAVNIVVKTYSISDIIDKKTFEATIHNYTGTLREKAVALYDEEKYEEAKELEFEILETHLKEFSMINVTLEKVKEDLNMLNILDNMKSTNSEGLQSRIKELFETYNIEIGTEQSDIKEIFEESRLTYYKDEEGI